MSDCAVVTEIGDTGKVADPLTDAEFPCATLVLEGEIVGVESAEKYTSCMSCKAKVKAISEVVGECNKCKMMVKLSRCKMSSTSFLLRPEDGEPRKVTLFHKELEAITSDANGSCLEETLLILPAVKLCINTRDSATSASIV